MYIKRICYPITSLGPGQRVGIWLTGCKKNCSGCMSPELKDMRAGKSVPVAKIVGFISTIEGKIDGVTISGGEPFLQADELLEFVDGIKSITDDIIVFSGFTLDELSENDTNKKILSKISVLIDGEYIEALNDGKGLRGSSNQKIHLFRNDEKYAALEEQPRVLQSYQYDDKVLLIGIQ